VIELDLDDRQTWFTPLKRVPDIVLIHLSDIHFKAADQGIRDRNKDLRDEILNALRRQKTHLHRYDGILVTGDIAFAGREVEFQIARKWLEALCEHLEIEYRNVLVIPGNHDVDRAVADTTPISTIRSEIRQKQGDELQATLTASLADSSGQLFEPLAKFNKFARLFGCDVSPQRPFWERRFPFSDGSELCVRGMTSTWVSGTGDCLPSYPMVLGNLCTGRCACAIS
jgi:hypothetical protein